MVEHKSWDPIKPKLGLSVMPSEKELSDDVAAYIQGYMYLQDSGVITYDPRKVNADYRVQETSYGDLIAEAQNPAVLFVRMVSNPDSKFNNINETMSHLSRNYSVSGMYDVKDIEADIFGIIEESLAYVKAFQPELAKLQEKGIMIPEQVMSGISVEATETMLNRYRQGVTVVHGKPLEEARRVIFTRYLIDQFYKR